MTVDPGQPVDPPRRSAADNPGRHLLGRVYRPDRRDWTMDRLLSIADPPESTRQATVEEMMATGYFTNWQWYLVFWRWLKKQLHPTPAPRPADAPGWELPIQLDQGATGHCVGFGWAGWVDATPVAGSYQNADGHALYYEAKIFDGEPRQENGSTVRSGALAVRARGRLAAFGFARNTAEIDDWIDRQGTIVVGTSWTRDMFGPDARGFVTPTGRVDGGHCYLLIDKLDAEDAYLFANSWSAGWGLNGRFKMRRVDFASLLEDDGEACCGLELAH